MKKSQEDAIPFVEFNLIADQNAKLSGIENINGSDAYVIVLGENKYYYDVKTALKIAESSEVENEGKKSVIWTYFNNYKAVDGIMVPYQVVQNLGFEIVMNVAEVLINSTINMEEFK